MRSGRAAAALFCGALVLLPGCGSSSKGKPIPAAQSDRLIKAIQAADQYAAGGKCTRAHTKVRDARFLLGQVPTSVSKDVRQGISDGLDRLDSLIGSQCQPPQQTQTTQSQTTPTQTTQTTTSQTQTTQSQTTPTQTTQTQTTQTQTTQTNTVPTSTTPTTTTGNGGTPPSTGTGAGAGANNQG